MTINTFAKKKSDIGTIATKISKRCFSNDSIVKVITEGDIIINKVSKAKKFLRHCRNSKNKNPRILYSVGKIYFNLQLFKEAIYVFQNLLKIDKHNIKAKNSLITIKKQIC